MKDSTVKAISMIVNAKTPLDKTTLEKVITSYVIADNYSERAHRISEILWMSRNEVTADNVALIVHGLVTTYPFDEKGDIETYHNDLLHFNTLLDGPSHLVHGLVMGIIEATSSLYEQGWWYSAYSTETLAYLEYCLAWKDEYPELPLGLAGRLSNVSSDFVRACEGGFPGLCKHFAEDCFQELNKVQKSPLARQVLTELFRRRFGMMYLRAQVEMFARAFGFIPR